jgi:hypothetical protein
VLLLAIVLVLASAQPFFQSDFEPTSNNFIRPSNTSASFRCEYLDLVLSFFFFLFFLLMFFTATLWVHLDLIFGQSLHRQITPCRLLTESGMALPFPLPTLLSVLLTFEWISITRQIECCILLGFVARVLTTRCEHEVCCNRLQHRPLPKC